MNHLAAITGTGLITVLGPSADQTWDSLLADRGILDHTRVPGIDSPDRALALAEIAGREAIAQAGWPSKVLSDASTALIIATSKGPIEKWLVAPAGAMSIAGIGEIASRLAAKLGFDQGPRMTLSAACASGLHGLIRATMMIQSGEIRRALVIAVEASLHPLFTASFDRLGVLPPPGFGCRPFDRDRKGFVLSEAAAAVCIESPACSALVGIDSYAMGGDATHLTHNDSNSHTLKRLLSRAINGSGIDLIHAHATGTVLNDPAELAALDSQFKANEKVATYSHKAALGHSLGASGLVSIVLNFLAHQRGVVPGNIRTPNSLPANSLSIAQYPRESQIRRSLAIAAGFGGTIAVVGLAST